MTTTIARDDRGFSLVEVLVSLTLFGLVMGGLAILLVYNSQINRAEQTQAEAQANARHSLTMVVQVLRSAGWDPMNTGLAPVALDPFPTDTDNFIQVFADLNEDGDTDDADEDVTVRHIGKQIEWRKTSDVTSPFILLADHITNDSDEDGTTEPMFVPDSTLSPTRVIVRITARSATPDPRSQQYFVYTVSSEVVLRKTL